MYVIRMPILMVEVPKLVAGDLARAALTPGQTYTTANGSQLRTLNGSHMALNQGTEVMDAYRVYCTSPVPASGTAPDFEYSFVVDGMPYRNFQLIDGSVDTNMAPYPLTTEGGPVGPDGQLIGGLELGKPFLSYALLGKPQSNMALLTTGLKAIKSLTVEAKSVAGYDYTAAGSGTPARIEVWGDILTDNLVAALQFQWQAAIRLNWLERQLAQHPLLDTAHNVSAVTMKTWQSLSGGPKQNHTKVQRLVRFASNAQATTANSPYFMTQNENLHGNPNNVADAEHDLGFYVKTERTAFWPQQWGVKWAPNLQFIGWSLDGKQIPDATMEPGIRVNQYHNLYNYGSAQPAVAASNRYNVVPKAQGRFYIFDQNGAPYILDNGTVIAAKAVTMAIAGPYVTEIQ